jgi:hypothetical protein
MMCYLRWYSLFPRNWWAKLRLTKGRNRDLRGQALPKTLTLFLSLLLRPRLRFRVLSERRVRLRILILRRLPSRALVSRRHMRRTSPLNRFLVGPQRRSPLVKDRASADLVESIAVVRQDFMGSSSVPYRREAHGVYSLQLYDKAKCRSIVELALRVDKWNEAEVGGDNVTSVDGTVRAARYVSRSRTAAIHDGFEHKVSRIVQPALRRVWGCDLPSIEGTQLVRYDSGGHYVPHKDADEHEYASRYFTVLCYLNENFSGGKTSFPSLGYSATPVTGKALIFPSRFVHCAEPVLSGQKLIFLTWLCGPIPLRWI